jgi:hypothetical protein
MKLLFSFILFCVYSFVSTAQTADNTAKLKALQDKKADYHKRTEGESDGFRIKIYFGSDRVKAMEVKSKFLGKFNDYGAYDEYQQPNFVILVGDFKTKPEAYGFLKEIQADFPNAFIVKDKIKLSY